VQCTKLRFPVSTAAAPPDWPASPSYQCRSSSSSLNSILWRFYTPQLPRLVKEGRVQLGYWSAVSIWNRTGPGSRGFSSQLLYDRCGLEMASVLS